jgi:hypothetical protein
MKMFKLQVVALAALTALAACAEAENDDGTLADSAAANADSANQIPTEPVVTGLDEVDDSGISGEATATHSANDVTVSILLKDDAKADVTYPAHIHTGTCEAGGPVAVELEPVKNLQSSKTVPLSSLPSNQAAFVQVHNPAGKAIACGNMQGHEAHDANRMGTDTTARPATY